jgi:hypothetical protein
MTSPPLTPLLRPALSGSKAVDQKEAAMSLLEHEAIRMAHALEDYDHVSVTDVGGNGSSHWLAIRDERFEVTYEISSHTDYWDFLIAFVWSSVPSAANSGEGNPKVKSEEQNSKFAAGQQWPTKPIDDTISSGVAVTRIPGSAAIASQVAPEDSSIRAATKTCTIALNHAGTSDATTVPRA